MSFYCDRQMKGFCYFLILYAAMILGGCLLFGASQTAAVKMSFLEHDAAVAGSLLEQGVPEEVAAAALTSQEASEAGTALLARLGMQEQAKSGFLPFIAQFRRSTFCRAILIFLLLTAVLFLGTLVFLERRRRLYQQAERAVKSYLAGDYSAHLPQCSEGALFQIFAMVEQLATMLQAQSEKERRTKDFLKNAISDISHQLKTPLAALAMYQEIMEEEPDNAETIKEFAAKSGSAIKRMECLIQSMLKLARLDTGNIVFEKSCYHVSEVILRSISELSARAEAEGKCLVTGGDPRLRITCDMEWTSEAIGTIIKNALDHTGPGGRISITWEGAPTMVRISVSDDGEGIAPEDLHHIFKRFYRSSHSLDTEGVGLGLPLAKSIVEGQGGIISVQSGRGEGTTFTISFLTEL